MKISQLIDEAKSYISSPLIRKIRSKKISYLSPMALWNIGETVKKLEEDNVEGIFIETGCALGGSAILIAKYKNSTRVLRVYDVFGMIPPPTTEDGEDVINRYEVIKEGKSKGINGDNYYGYEKDLLNLVKQNFKDFGVDIEKENVELIQGLFEDKLVVNEKVAFAHLDGDWYSSTITCLERIVPNLSQNGILIIDDYNAWSGCRKAVDEYFDGKKEGFEFTMKAKKLHIKKL